MSRGRLLVDPRIRPLRPFAGARRLVGPAVTAWCEPGDIGAALHAVALARAGDVIVIDGDGYLQSALIGEHVCGSARRQGVAGMVVNGAVRDVGPLASWPDFPVDKRAQPLRISRPWAISKPARRLRKDMPRRLVPPRAWPSSP